MVYPLLSLPPSLPLSSLPPPPPSLPPPLLSPSLPLLSPSLLPSSLPPSPSSLPPSLSYQFDYKMEAMRGMGVDRHLFGLYVIAKGLKMDPLPKMFTDKVCQLLAFVN